MAVKEVDNLVEVVNVFATIPLLELALVRFKDKTHKPSKYRYWVVFRFEENEFCVLSTITSQLDYIGRFYRNDENAANSVVVIQKDEFNPPLSKVSYIDCNIKAANHKRYADLSEKIIDWKKGLEKSSYVIPENIKTRIIEAILNSDHTSEDVKKAFRDKYGL